MSTVGFTGDLGRSGSVLAQARADGRAALVGYLPVGFPDVPTSLSALSALGESGVDLVEIGMPYSDPVMDGPAIQRAGTEALSRGVHVRDVFTAVETVTATTPAVVMIYWNLVEHYGVRAFARDLAAAGGAGLITPDLVPDEADEWIAASDEFGLDRIFLLAPSSTDARIVSTVAACRGWVYATSVMGVTGTRTDVPTAAPALLDRIRRLAGQLPIGVGLGVSNGEQAARIGQYADAVIVGSALVKSLLAAEDAGTPSDLTALNALVGELARGVGRVAHAS